MKTKDTIVQFVCYETNMNTESFVVQWERFTKRFLNKGIQVTLQEQASGKNKFKFLSRNVWPEDSFQFVFMEGRLSHNFPEGHVKVVEAGGYTPLQVECTTAKSDMVIVTLFSKNPQSDIAAFKKMEGYRHLNIYEAYYESCRYVYILEFFVKESACQGFVKNLELNNHLVEIGIYKEYSMLAV
jgi:hypothetical protein